MTSISATGYTAYSATAYASAAAKTSSAVTDKDADAATSDSATSVTLSEAAKAAQAAPDIAAVVAAARVTLDELFTRAGNGAKAADLDLSGLDRRSLYAITADAAGAFTADEHAAAGAEVSSRFDAALEKPYAAYQANPDVQNLDDLYQAAVDYLDQAPAEEKTTPAWVSQKDAIAAARKQLAADPLHTPSVAGDPVAAYIAKMTAADTPDAPAADDIPGTARAALDKQYAAAKAAGTELVFDRNRKVGQQVDFSSFDSRTLSAVALNEGGQFSTEEINAASTAMRSRSGTAVLAAFQDASDSGDPAAFAQNLISAFGSLSPEERQAAGWSDQFYAAAVANYKSMTQLTNMLGAASSSGSGSTGMSLTDYL